MIQANRCQESPTFFPRVIRRENSCERAMKRIERYRIVNMIAVKLQAGMNTSNINVFLGGFGIEHDCVDIVPSKRVYVEGLLAKTPDAIICQIARELDVDIPVPASESALELQSYLDLGGLLAAQEDFERALQTVESDPSQALGSSSSTLESIAKSILDEFEENYPADESLQPLLKAVFKKMDLSPEGHADAEIKRILGGLLSAAIGIGVLRTKYSSFHGKGGQQRRNRLTARHARMAVHATATVGLFLIETYHDRISTVRTKADRM